MLRQTQTFLLNWFLKKELAKTVVHRRSVSLGEARFIGILTDANQPGTFLAARNLADRLKSENKRVEMLAFQRKVPKEATSNARDEWVFSRKDLDFALRPQKGSAVAFMKKPFDLLFYCAVNPVPELDYLASLSKAGFRVGPFSQTAGASDLMIVPDRVDAQTFAGLMIAYLEQLNPKPLLKDLPERVIAAG